MITSQYSITILFSLILIAVMILYPILAGRKRSQKIKAAPANFQKFFPCNKCGSTAVKFLRNFEGEDRVVDYEHESTSWGAPIVTEKSVNYYQKFRMYTTCNLCGVQIGTERTTTSSPHSNIPEKRYQEFSKQEFIELLNEPIRKETGCLLPVMIILGIISFLGLILSLIFIS